MLCVYDVMHNVYMQAHHNHMNLAHTHHQSRMYLVYYMMYEYNAHRSRRDHMYMTRCYTRSETRSRRTWFSWRCMIL